MANPIHRHGARTSNSNSTFKFGAATKNYGEGLYVFAINFNILPSVSLVDVLSFGLQVCHDHVAARWYTF